MTDIHIDSESCIACGNCVRLCPNGILIETGGVPDIHPKRECINCFHCIAACPIGALEHGEAVRAHELTEPDALEKLVVSRRSVRHFLEEAPRREVIERALAAVDWVPSGKNRAENRYVVVYGRQKTDALREIIKTCLAEGGIMEQKLLHHMKKGHDLLTGNAPCLIFGIGAEDMHGPQVNITISMTTLELLLQDHGVGTCWAGYVTEFAESDERLRTFLGLGEDEHVFASMMVGLPDENYMGIPPRIGRDVRWVED